MWCRELFDTEGRAERERGEQEAEEGEKGEGVKDRLGLGLRAAGCGKGCDIMNV